MFSIIRSRHGASNKIARANRPCQSVKPTFDPLEARETPAVTAAPTILPMAAATYGSAVPIQAMVTPNPGMDAGTLSFYDNGQPIAGANSVPLDASGVGTFQVSSLSAGNHDITAVYTGSSGTDVSPMSSAVSETINPAPLMVGGITAADRTYDATNSAALDVSSAYLIGRMPNDQVDLNVVGSSGTFADAHVGTSKPVTISGLSLTGESASNYTLVPPTATATINPLPLNVTGITANNKAFDNSTMALLNTSQAGLQGVISPDVVNLNTTNATGSFASANAGAGVPVNVSGLSLDNPDYTLNPFTTTADITSENAPSVANVTVNGGNGGFSGPQGSRVTSLKLDFGQPVQLDTGAVSMALHTNNVSYAGTAMASGMGSVPTLVLTPNADGSSWTVTFSGDNAQMGGDGFASLMDGVYDVNVNGAMVHPTSNPSSSLSGTSTTTFAQLFGDVSGPTATPNGTSTDYSATVNSIDNLAFRAAFNNDANYKPYLDFDGNGVINSLDNLAFRQRFNKTLTYTA